MTRRLRYAHRHGFHKVMKAVDDKVAYFARSCNYTYNLGY